MLIKSSYVFFLLVVLCELQNAIYWFYICFEIEIAFSQFLHPYNPTSTLKGRFSN